MPDPGSIIEAFAMMMMIIVKIVIIGLHRKPLTNRFINYSSRELTQRVKVIIQSFLLFIYDLFTSINEIICV